MPPSIVEAKLSDYTTFQLGGMCRGLINAETPDDCRNAVKYLNEQNLPFIVIGSGSNLVVSDQGIDCHVIRYVSDAPIFDFDQSDVIVSGSTNLNVFVNVMAQIGLGGVNYCSGIPGTVAGAVVGNAGAFGRQIGDVLKSVRVISPQGEEKTITADELEFSYRHSKLKETDDIVLEVTLVLESSDSDALLAEREQILKARAEKHPDLSKEPCAGSFFRNIEPTSDAGKRQAAGWFLDQAGGKELKAGGAYIFDKHANIIIKGKDATSEDVFSLSKKMQDLIMNAYQLELIREVRFVGAFNEKPGSVTDIIW